MENILFGTTIPDLTAKTFADLTEGQIGLLLYNFDEKVAPLQRGIEVTNAELLAARAIQYVRKTGTELEGSVLIPNKTTNDRNYQAYVAGVAGVWKIGDNTVTGSLVFTNPGEGNIRLVDLTNTYKADNFPANISVTKKTGETDAAYLGRVVTAINNDPVAKLLCTAALETNTGKYQIKLTATSYKIKLGVATDGLFAGYQATVVTARVLALGTGEQMQEIEKQLTVFKGNGNYTEWTNEYFSAPLKSSLATNYNTLSVTWTGVAQPTVSTTMSVASLNLLICVPSADTSLATLYTKFTTPAPIVP